MSEFVNLDPDAQFGCACCRPIWTLWTTSRRSMWMLWASSFANLDALDAEFERPGTQFGRSGRQYSFIWMLWTPRHSIWTLWTSRFVNLDALDAQKLNLDAQTLNLVPRHSVWTLWTSRFVHLDAVDAHTFNLDAQTLYLDALDIQVCQCAQLGRPDLQFVRSTPRRSI